MIVISYGIRKSGSTLAFEMAKAVLELNGSPQAMLPSELLSPAHNGADRHRVNHAGPWTDDVLARIVEAAAGTTTVVRTHAHPYRLSPAGLTELLRSGELKIHVVIRDPRDIVLSMLDEARAKPLKDKARTVDEAIERLRPRLEKLRCWGSFPSLKLPYDDFAFDPVQGPQLIADDLGVAVDPAEVWKILDNRFTRKNVAQPHRYTTDMSSVDAARIAVAFPDFVQMVEKRVYDWFARGGSEAKEQPATS